MEGGLHAHRVALFGASTQSLSVATSQRHAELVVLALNYNLLHSWDMPDPRSGDKRVLALLDAAYVRLAAASGVAAIPAAEARQRIEAVIQRRGLEEDSEDEA